MSVGFSEPDKGKVSHERRVARLVFFDILNVFFNFGALSGEWLFGGPDLEHLLVGGILHVE